MFGLLALQVFGAGEIRAQNEGSIRFVESRLSHGFIIIHNEDVEAVRNSYPWGFEVDLGWQSNSEEAWNRCNCHTRMGASLGAWDFDNQDILGQGYVAQFFLEPEFGAQRDLSFSVRAGFGLSYKTKPFHPETNPENLSYSTAVAFPLQLGTALRWQFSERWQAHILARYNHISNGGFRQPNKGINWPTVSVGVTWYARKPDLRAFARSDWRTDGDGLLPMSLSVFGGYQELNNGIVLGVGGVEWLYRRQVGRLSALTGGTEWIYHGRYPYQARQEGESTHGFMGGVAVGHAFLLGNFIFGQQMGVYLLRPQGERHDLYQRYSLMYMINDEWGAGISLKAHAHVADFIDFRTAFYF